MYRRIITGLFSDREKSYSNPKTTDIFQMRTLSNVIRLMSHYSRFKSPPLISESFDIQYDFFDKANYRVKSSKSFDTWADFYEAILQTDLKSFFNTLEIYCFTLQEWCGKVIQGQEHVISFVKDFNDLMSLNETNYKLIAVGNRIQVQKIDSEVTEEQVIEEALRITNNSKFQKVNKEYGKALKEKTANEFPKALTMCNTCLETTLCIILNKEKGKLAELYKEFIKKYDVPPIFQNNAELIQGLVGKIGGTASSMGDRHGEKEKKKTEGIEEITEFITNLTGSFIIYLIKTSEK